MELIERYQLTQYDKESMMQGNKKLANHKNFICEKADGTD